MRTLNILATAALAALVFAPAPASAQPGGQPVKVIFPFAAGGSGDALARMIAERIGKETGRGGIVENRNGAGGRIGVNAVKNAAPDGGTILITAFAPMSIYPLFYGDKLGYDPVADFTPISQPVTFEFALAVSNAMNVKTLAELAATLKKDASKAVFGTPGAGTLPHFLGLETGKKIGASLRMIAFRGSALGINDLAAGQLPMMVTLTPDFAPHHEAGKIRILATFGGQRSIHVKNVPTMKELGHDLEGYGWYGVYGPARVPPELAARYSKIIADMVREPATRDRLVKMGLDPAGTTGPELAAIQKRDREFWAGPVKASGFQPKQ